MKEGKWSLATRLLHMGLALTVSLQLAISLVMEPPDAEHASQLARAAFEAHEVVGMTALLIVTAHWLWSLTNQVDGGVARLFPFNGTALAEVKIDISQLMKGELPEGGSRGGLPGLIHGLGFLAVTGMVISGGILFFIFPETGKPNATVEFFAGIHGLIAPLVWVYWGSHIAMGLMHKKRGHSTVQDMFNLKP